MSGFSSFSSSSSTGLDLRMFEQVPQIFLYDSPGFLTHTHESSTPAIQTIEGLFSENLEGLDTGFKHSEKKKFKLSETRIFP